MAASVSSVSAHETVTLDSLKWKHRVVLLPPLDSSESNDVWALYAAELRDRDVILFRGVQGVYRQWFPRRTPPRVLKVPPKIRTKVDDRVALIGKDGGIKRQWKTEDWDLPTEVFARIDTMPMRQQEMRAKARRGR